MGGSACWGEGDSGDNAPKIGCSAGTYSQAGKSSCTDCAKGKYSASSKNKCTDCPKGRYSGVGQPNSCETCPAGKKRVKRDTASESEACEECVKGKYSESSKNECTDCPEGRYSGVGQPNCIACDAGKKGVRSDTASKSEACEDCAEGKYSAESSLEKCTDCPTGRYSGVGQPNCIACDAGKKRVKSDTASLLKACEDCAEGKYSESSSDECTICPAGTYGDNTGLDICTICPKGRYNADGDADGGIHAAKHDSLESCTQCHPGKYIADDATDKEEHDDAAKCVDCPGQTKSNAGENGFGSDDCVQCPLDGEGFSLFAPPGNDRCVSCDAGYICRVDRKEACQSGRYSDGTHTECQLCPVGSICKGSSKNELCPPGKYQDKPGKTECNDCELGKYNLHFNKTMCDDCEEGFFCPKRSESMIACEGVGLFCPPKSGVPKVPGKGNYTLPIDQTSKRTSEKQCEAGFACVGGVKKPCPANTFAGVGQDYCERCPDFQESDEGSSECRCQAGFFNRTHPTTGKLLCECPAGKRLSEGACVLCPSGSFKDEISNANSCMSCDQKAVRNSFSTYVHIRLSSNLSTDGFEPVDKTACSCDRQYYFVEEPDGDFIGSCKECPENTNCDQAGLNLATLPVNPGYWRSSNDSSNIVKCYTEDSCNQKTNQTNRTQCSDGHKGPICNVCDQGYAKDYTGTCEWCKNGSNLPPEMVALIVILSGVAILASVVAVRRMMSGELSAANEIRRARHDNKSWMKRLRTSVKIFSSFYQVTSQFEDTLNVRFPANFENFMRKMKGFVTLDVIKVAKVGCLVEVNFYKKLQAMTVGPIAASFTLLLISGILIRLAKSKEIRANIVENASAIFFSITYIVFAGVSTTVLDTYNCKTYGDDPTEYLVSDQSLSCGSEQHQVYVLYASIMIFVYPVGIPLLYFVLLWMKRKQLREERLRDEDPSLLKTSFLWDEYRCEYWWFEVFDCLRRLSQTGLLIFLFRGRISQIVVAIIMSVVYLGLVIHWKPYAKWSDNQLAIASQVAIFFTLFSALLTKVDVDEKDAYDEMKFGFLLIFVNCLVIAMFILQLLVKPWKVVVKKFGRTHKHGGVLRGLPEDPQWQVYWEYWDWLVDSNVDDAGWDEMTPRQFRMSKKPGKKWMERTGAVGNWRCSGGNGPIDQLRISFPLEAEYADVVNYALKDEALAKGTFKSQVIEKKFTLRINDDQSVDEYMLMTPPYFWWKYDFFARRFVKKNEHSYDILRKSLTWKQEGKYEASSKFAFRADICLDGIRIESLQGGERCKVTRIIMVDFNADFLPDDLMQRLIGPRWLRATVDEYSLLSKEQGMGEEEGGGGKMTRALAKNLTAASKSASSVLSAVKRRTTFGKNSSSGVSENSADIEMNGRGSDFSQQNPMTGKSSCRRTAKLPTLGINPNYDMSCFADERSSKKMRLRGRRKRFIESNFNKAKSAVRKAVPQALGKQGSALSYGGEGWVVRVDPESGDFYYENEETGKTQWEAPKGTEPKTTRVLGIWNMISIDDLAEGANHSQLVAEVTEECSELGKIEELFVPEREDRGAGTVFVKYEDVETAKKAKKTLEARSYQVTCKGEEWFRTAWWE
ncbi:hypothetical protein TrVE_jg11238 [Triparma verrucosa]|uniref:WW domain-containing protein n=1 Tax=Triparma verrucosa TaxID=1606542 RepID=A0A9W7KX11_9STRA|nr:hypothetical protein TrVE_jg11238 [Triparma verrucosa]